MKLIKAAAFVAVAVIAVSLSGVYAMSSEKSATSDVLMVDTNATAARVAELEAKVALLEAENARLRTHGTQSPPIPPSPWSTSSIVDEGSPTNDLVLRRVDEGSPTNDECDGHKGVSTKSSPKPLAVARKLTKAAKRFKKCMAKCGFDEAEVNDFKCELDTVAHGLTSKLPWGAVLPGNTVSEIYFAQSHHKIHCMESFAHHLDAEVLRPITKAYNEIEKFFEMHKDYSCCAEKHGERDTYERCKYGDSLAKAWMETKDESTWRRCQENDDQYACRYAEFKETFDFEKLGI